uniref:Peptidase A2 domain-containing protein n=1 Tax=Anopheles darlingi TaxID=43151 RepID=A0A2M4CWG1_ANODA
MSDRVLRSQTRATTAPSSTTADLLSIDTSISVPPALAVDLNATRLLEHESPIEFAEDFPELERSGKLSDHLSRSPGKKPIKMEYQFPMELALRVVPEFTGRPRELDGFLYQLDSLAAKIPEKESTQDLVQVVLGKLRGSAANYFRRIRADTWEEVRARLKQEFGGNLKFEAVVQQVELLEQKKNEDFRSYKDRVLDLWEHLEDYKSSGEEGYPLRLFRRHVVLGLRDSTLKAVAKSHRDLGVKELLELLEEEQEELELDEGMQRRKKDISPRKEYSRDVHYRPPQSPEPRFRQEEWRDRSRRGNYAEPAPSGWQDYNYEEPNREYNQRTCPSQRYEDNRNNWNGSGFARNDHHRWENQHGPARYSGLNTPRQQPKSGERYDQQGRNQRPDYRPEGPRGASRNGPIPNHMIGVVKFPLDCTGAGHITVQINTKNGSEVAEFLVDTGATVNLLRWRDASDLGMVRINTKETTKLSGISGRSIETLGTCELDLQIGEDI